jgi:hypothetical protein
MRDTFGTFNSDVAHVASSWARVTHDYSNDDLLSQFMHATPMQVKKIWHRFNKELASYGSEDAIRHISKKIDGEKTRLPMYK